MAEHAHTTDPSIRRKRLRTPGQPAPENPPVYIPLKPSHRPTPPPAAPYDFSALTTVTDHRDADLLANLARLTELRDQIEIAKRRGSTAFNRTLGVNCRECVALEAIVGATPALTSEGRRAKAMHALREADPDAPSGGFSGFNAVVFSALWDIVQAGGL